MTAAEQPEGPVKPPEDLGFGGVVIQRSRGRFLNRDGTPSARKYGLGRQFWARTFLHAVGASWTRFLIWAVALVLLVNGAFALAYLALAPGLSGTEALRLTDPFLAALYYSIGVFTGLGTGPIYPVGETATWLTVFEAVLGVLSVIAMVGIMLAKVTRPRANIRFSQSAAMAPYQGGRGFMFRLVNLSPAELFEVSARVNLAWFEENNGKRERRFHELNLERASVEFFTLHWTVVHPIDRQSPLAGVTPDKLREGEAEFLIQIAALDSTFSARVVSRMSYIWEEVRWDAKFADVFVQSPDGVVTIDVDRLDRLDRLEEGTTRIPSPAETSRTPYLRRTGEEFEVAKA